MCHLLFDGEIFYIYRTHLSIQEMVHSTSRFSFFAMEYHFFRRSMLFVKKFVR
jgi:hypothetical protein